MPKVLTIVGVSILALSLVLGIALPVAAASDTAKSWASDFQSRIEKGKVTSIDQGNQQFVIKDGEKEVTIKVDGNTKYFKLAVPGRTISQAPDRTGKKQDRAELRVKVKINKLFGEEAKFSDINVGNMVAVWLAKDSQLAERVQIIEPTTYASVSGTITAISSSAITIISTDGKPVTLSCDKSTEFTIRGATQVQSGQSARAIYDSGNMTAKIVKVN